MPHRRALAIGAALVALAPPAAAPPAPRHTTPAVPGAPAVLHWQPCPSVSWGLVCSSLSVPLDYAPPRGRRIILALSEAPATAGPGQRLGDLVVNPGGPGVPGRYLAALVQSVLPASLASRYNIIGFDPRGVGASVPSMHCDPTYLQPVQPDYVPATQADELALEAKARGYAQACERRYGWLLPYMTTVDTARDLGSLRVALGVSRISYLGFSYGTYIGEVYATLFPHRVARMVLDSTVDPQGVWYVDNLAQDVAAQARMHALFAWTARYASTYHLGTTAAGVEAAFLRARARLAASPVPHQLGPDELDDDFVAGLYSTSVWPSLAAALAAYLHQGSPAVLETLYATIGATNENEFAVYNAVECSDARWPRDWQRWDTDTRRLLSRAPLVTWDNTWFNAACAFWPVTGPAKPFRVGAPGLPGVLMVQASLDAATPYPGALQAHRDLPSSRMVVVEGDGNHGQLVSTPPNLCVIGYVARYLATGALPTGPGPVNATCPPAALPTP